MIPPPDTAPSEIVGEGDKIAVLDAPVDATLTPPSYVPEHPIAKRIMSEKAATQMANILRDVILHGTARSALKLGRGDIAGKTGTTNDAKDAWFAGFQPKLVAVSWVGFDKPASLGRREYGGYAALPLWNSFMDYALSDVEEAWFDGPIVRNTSATTPNASTNTNEANNNSPTPSTDETPNTETKTTPQAAAEDLF